jgi:hypothetical protein
MYARFVLILLTGCSALDPTVGPPVVMGCTLGSNGYGSSQSGYSTPPSGETAIADFCTIDGGSIEGTCDTCEAMSCCMQRVECYLDQVCSCADMTLDNCTADAAVTDVCWTTFVSSGAIGAARYQCLQASCAAACQITTD